MSATAATPFPPSFKQPPRHRRLHVCNEHPKRGRRIALEVRPAQFCVPQQARDEVPVASLRVAARRPLNQRRQCRCPLLCVHPKSILAHPLSVDNLATFRKAVLSRELLAVFVPIAAAAVAVAVAVAVFAAGTTTTTTTTIFAKLWRQARKTLKGTRRRKRRQRYRRVETTRRRRLPCDGPLRRAPELLLVPPPWQTIIPAILEMGAMLSLSLIAPFTEKKVRASLTF
mmetsp:Transcript_51804/g.102766  ORF Transcript_51804/g.102766 Transcript_51804/m.102766 type:complete len:228 (-) Transcript_51804:64-747(-)